MVRTVTAEDGGQRGTTLIAEKTATGYWERTFHWTIDKSVTPSVLNLFIGDSDFADYTVTVTKTGYTDIFTVEGQVCVTNGGAFATENLRIVDVIQTKVGSGPFSDYQSVTLDLSEKPVLAPGETYCYDYAIPFTPVAGAQYKNVARITITNHAGYPGEPFGPEPKADFSLPEAPNRLVNDTINVEDTNGEAWSTSASATWTYSREFVCSDDLTDYVGGIDTYVHPNIAEIIETEQSDNASVRVNCYIPTVTKTAGGTYDERHEWEIEKTVAPETQNAFAGATLGYTWTVTVTESVFEENFDASGTITVVNPAPMAMPVSLEDVFDDGTIPAISGCTNGATYVGGVLTVPASTTTVCSYAANDLPYTDDAAAPDLNTATVTLNGFEFEATAGIGWTVNVIRGSATVTDDQIGLNRTISDGGIFTGFEEYTCSANRDVYGADGFYAFIENNTAIVSSGGELDRDSATETINCYMPSIVKTAAGTYDERHEWDIQKTVDPATQVGFAGDLFEYTWTVTVDETPFEENFDVSGTITVTNPATMSMTAALDDVLNDDTIVFIGGCTNGASYSGGQLTVPAGVTTACGYSVNDLDYEDHEEAPTINTATLSLNSIDYVATDAIEWVANVIRGSATVTDDQIGLNETVTGDGTFTGGERYACSTTMGDYDEFGYYRFSEYNVATISSGGSELDRDDATETIDCYALLVTKTANTSMDRTWHWGIDKSSSTTELTLATGQFMPVSYSVTVSVTGFTDSGWAVAGTVTVANPAPIAASIASITDPEMGSALDCGDIEFPYELAAEGSLECTYEKDLPDADGFTNTAYAELGNGTVFDGSADVIFDDDSITHIDTCVNVTDSQAGSLGSVCLTSSPHTFTYTREIGGYLTCGEYTADNTAVFVTNDTGTTGSSSWNILVHVPCGGCTLTPGYWKTHSAYGPARYDDTWAGREYTLFFLSGKSWYQVLWTPPAGNPYYQLSFQYIAAYLNKLNGAASTSAVDSAMAWAVNFFNTYSPTANFNKNLKAQIISNAGILSNYNAGYTGPGHCSE